MPKSHFFESSSARFTAFLLLAALLVSTVQIFPTAHAATQSTWTGAHPPTTLSSPGNWVGNVAPSAGDDLFFPSSVKRKSIRNNYPNQTSFNSLNFSGSNYNLRKNSLTLTGGINTSNPTGSNQISLPLQISGAQTFTSANSGSTLTLNGQVTLNSNLTVAGAGNTLFVGVVSASGGLTKSGSGTLTLAGNNTYSGATTMTAGSLIVNGSQSSSNVTETGGILGGSGRVGAITSSGGSVRPGTSFAPAILSSDNVTLSPATSFVIDLDGTTAGTGYRQLNVNGSVNLGGSVLDASANFQSAVDDTFTIINNDGNDSVTGTFAGLAEGATITLGGQPFSISYQGGSGNDVVLTRLQSVAPAPPAISISDVTLVEGDSGTTQASFTLTLSASSNQTVTVDYATADETAMAPDDYASTAGTLAFNPGETVKTINVLVTGETLNEIDESFILGLRRSTNASLSDPEGRATIMNDDAAPTLSVGDVGVIEGNTGVVDAVLPVTLSAQSGKTVTVNYATADGTATEHPGNDYAGVSGTITFAPGETDDEVDVTVNGDTNVESTETFFVNLTGETNSTLADAQGLGTITDDDSATPTPTPTPTPSPSPTPTPSPSPTPTPSPSPTPTPSPSPTPTPSPSPTPTPSPSPTPSPTPVNPGDTVQFNASSFSVDEGAGSVTITVSRSGNTSNAASVEYGTFDLSASERSDYTTSLGTLRFAPGETSKSFLVFITNDAYIEGSESLTLSLGNPQGVNLGSQSSVGLTITDNDFAPTTLNPIDDAGFYVRQHYVDFLNREPDPSGLAFWTNEFTVCGSDARCIADRRVNVSAAYFLSIEFQQTGYMIYLMQKASYGNMPRYREFLGNTQEIGRGVVVGAPGWEALLEANKTAFVEQWVNRPAFRSLYDGMSDTEFVDALFSNAGIVDTTARNSMIAALQSATDSRSSVLRQLTENSTFSQKEFNASFVLMQYFGYLRRNPDDAPDSNFDGFNFWLNKLNQNNGNYVNAEMVKAFILSTEYRQRFGQP